MVMNIPSASPTFADDIAVVALYKPTLQRMFATCYQFSLQWRFDFNARKSEVIIFGRDECPTRMVMLGDQAVKETDSCKHMGVLLATSNAHKVQCIADKIQASKKEVGAIMGLGNCRVPVTTAAASKLYWSVSVPKLAYGIPVSELPDGAMDALEHLHGAAAKRFQGLPSQTANSACLATLGWWSMEAHIDYLMLIFLWKLLVLPVKSIYKQVVICRLWTHIYRTEGLHMGPVHCILKVFVKYDLMDMLQSALLSGTYMSMLNFKRFIKCKIKQSENARFRITCELHKSLIIYRECITQIKIWPWFIYINRFRPQYGHRGRIIAKLLYEQSHVGVNAAKSMVTRTPMCINCDAGVADGVPHVLFACNAQTEKRSVLWQKVLSSAPQALALQLCQMNNVLKTHFVLSPLKSDFIPEWIDLYDDISDFLYQMYMNRSINIQKCIEGGS
jgi:hypothetical protein